MSAITHSLVALFRNVCVTIVIVIVMIIIIISSSSSSRSSIVSIPSHYGFVPHPTCYRFSNDLYLEAYIPYFEAGTSAITQTSLDLVVILNTHKDNDF